MRLRLRSLVFGASALVVLFAPPSPADAHPGGTDAAGCHACRTSCPSHGLADEEYHCHDGGGDASTPAPAASSPPPPADPATTTTAAPATTTPSTSASPHTGAPTSTTTTAAVVGVAGDQGASGSDSGAPVDAALVVVIVAGSGYGLRQVVARRRPCPVLRPRLRPLDGAVLTVVAVASILLAVRLEPSGGAAEATTSPEPATTGPSTSAPPPTSEAAPPVEAEPPVAVELAALRIDDSRLEPPGYSRDLFPSWLDLDGNGCDTRDDVLVAESLTAVAREGCDVISGAWVSIYDELELTDPSELDVDHLVPLAEAWRSGAHGWSTERRARFANHLDDGDHLIAVSASSNRSKGDRAPDQWRPPSEASWCRYATAWVSVKVTWDLTATTTERDALGQMLELC